MSVGKCTSWRGHRFEARYSNGAPTLGWEQMNWLPYSQRIVALTASRPITYEGDVCTRCGLVVNMREKSAETLGNTSETH